MPASSTLRIFGHEEFEVAANRQSRRLRDEVFSAAPEYVTGVGRDEYVAYLVAKYAFQPVELDFAQRSASRTEAEIPAKWFPPGFDVETGKTYLKPVVVYHIPFRGDVELLALRPNTSSIHEPVLVLIEDGCVCFDFIVFRDNPDDIKQRADRTISIARHQYEALADQVAEHNRQLPLVASAILNQRLGQLQQQADFMERLGVPLRKSTTIPATFEVPIVRKSLTLQPPAARTLLNERALHPAMYEEILRVIHEAGRAFERLPSLYRDKDEEALRDYFLPYLESHFTFASATGETFNKTGKTDILVRYEGHNVFVAECKIWSGPQGHHDALGQLLSYVTWRDTKTALVYFVKNQRMTATIEGIQQSTPTHPHHVRFTGTKNETWCSYEFHPPDDPDRRIHVTILCFHTP